MAIHEWVFGNAASAVHLSVAIDTVTGRITVESYRGSLDLNALWFSDGDRLANEAGGSTALAGSANALNMNGSGVVWDDVAILSRAGLGREGTAKATFVSDGETIVIDGAAILAGYAPEDWGALTLGIRATSVNGSGGLKAVAGAATGLAAGADVVAGDGDGGPVTGNVLANDAGRAGNALAVASFSVQGLAGVFAAGETATIAGVGALTIAADGSFAFTPAAGFSGEVPLVTYTATDAEQAGSALGVTLTSTLAISVTGTNEAPTGIVLQDATLVVDENIAGAAFGTLATQDPDQGDTHAYTVDDARFEVTGQGVLKLKANASLDHEQGPQVSVSVTSTDSGNASVTRQFTIQVNNRDELPPAFTSAPTASAAENIGAGQVVYVAAAADDAGDAISGGLTYGLKNVGDVAAFSINGANGAVTLVANPDFETKPIYAFTVTATDGAGNTSELPVTLAISDVSEPPVEPPPPVPKTMTFNAGVNGSDSYAEGGMLMTTVEPTTDGLRFGNFFFADPDLETQALNPDATPLRFERVGGGTFDLVSLFNHSGTGTWLGFNGATQVASQTVSTPGTNTFSASFAGLTHVLWTITGTGLSGSQSIDNLVWV